MTGPTLRLGAIALGWSLDDWLRLARQCPALARLLFTAAREISDVAASDWVAVFSGCPPWSAVVSAFDEVELRPDDVSNWRLAHLACLICRQFAAGDPDAVFWQVLLRQSDSVSRPNPHWWRLWPLLADFERFVNLAYWLLAVPQHEPRYLPTPIMRSLEPARWRELLAEADNLRKIEPIPWSPELADRLRSEAHRRALEQTLERERTDRDIRAAKTTEALGQALARWLQAHFLGPSAIWTNLTPSGLGVIVQGKGHRLVTSPRKTFEWSELPACLRSSTPIRSQAELFLGYIYTVGWTSSPHEKAASLALGKALEEWKASDAERRELATLRTEFLVGENFPERLRRELRASIREFAAGAGHEINNPLGAIRGSAEMLLDEIDEPAHRLHLHKILLQVERIHRMIRDLHFVGCAESGVRERIEVARLVEEAVASARFVPPASLRIHAIDPALTLEGVREDLVRLLAELVANAAKAAGPAGRVEITADLLPSDRPTVRIAVSDSGPGFSEVDRRFAFDPFYSGRTAGRGLGMGLTVAEAIAARHDGSIYLGWARPTTVSVALPAISQSKLREALPRAS